MSTVSRLLPVMAMVVGLLPVSGVAQLPTDNPVATYYSGPEGYPAWTDTVRWSCAIDMSKYGKGRNDFERFENARDELAGQGGGVLYYPAGTYDFSSMPADGPGGRGLMLRSGVVIRGQAPAGKRDARTGRLELPTQFVFGFKQKGVDAARKYGGQAPRDWNIIGTMPSSGEQLKDVHHVGICWVKLVGATVYFGPQLKWGPTWGTAEGWKSKYVKPAWKDRVPDGTSPLDAFLGAPLGKGSYIGAGRCRLVFGCVLEDSAVLNDCFQEGNGPEAFYAYKFGPRISVYGNRVLVANNVLPRSTKNFKYAQTTRKTSVGRGGNSMILGEFVPDTTILFDYGKTCGIDINKESAASFGGGVYDEGVVVRDNWVFNHGHRGFNLSGRWMSVCNNHNERVYLRGGDDAYGLGGGWVLTLDGNLRSNAGGNGAISDNLSRAFDLAGKDIWVDGNYFENVGSNPGNDGEGILCQAHGGTHIAGWAVTHNRHEKGNGQSSYIGAWDVDMLGCLIAWNQTAGWVGAVNVGKRQMLDCAIVANKASKVNAFAGAITEQPGKPCPQPREVKGSVYGGDAVKITWSDASDDEIGFRVDRSMDGGATWTPIAYRPPHAKNPDPDALTSIDFTAPAGKPLLYRVAALATGDNDPASAPSEPIIVQP